MNAKQNLDAMMRAAPQSEPERGVERQLKEDSCHIDGEQCISLSAQVGTTLNCEDSWTHSKSANLEETPSLAKQLLLPDVQPYIYTQID